jgi:translation elongation factor EF-1alpha
MFQTARGTFKVQMKPAGEPSTIAGVSTGRMSLDKQFDGDRIATGHAEMHTALTQKEVSAGDVAIERITGTPHARSGSLVLQHSGIMTKGAQHLATQIVPGSETDQLLGIQGKFKLTIAEDRHFCELEYSLSSPIRTAPRAR